eukprot:TRINITY_DN8004_c0_g3_i1.p1 TRINITY_DN8004_c0_g3~~TRINITY_DN8004_c0_g3_i1.p1  ORF type:complete len:353 (-),score=73.26 TRINITY_DN8004_c0_g3_i1:59-1117(-)
MEKKRKREDVDDGEPSEIRARFQPSMVKNKLKRSELTAKLRNEKKKDKKQRMKKRKKEEEQALALGEAPPPKKIPRTIESARAKDETIIQPDDDELHAGNAHDEFWQHFARETTPKVLITTCQNPSKVMYRFISDLMTVIPAAHFYRRGAYHIKQIVKFATNRDFTSLIVINENRKRVNGLLLIGLPEGPTAHFKLSNLKLSKKIKNHGRSTKHMPELILNNFTTRLGHRVGRMIASIFPQDPQFRGRRVVTFHNQRDFIFFRHHRYIFEEKAVKAEAVAKKKSSSAKAVQKTGTAAQGNPPEPVIARLQECGPRFTLKLLSLQHGTFDSKYGEYEWVHKPDMDTSRTRFFL